MSKHNKVDKKEQERFNPSFPIINLLEKIKKNNKSKNEIKVLDWGCGRGKMVAYLRNEGIKAYGVDIDKVPISNSIDFLNKKDKYEILSILKKNKTQFPDQFFDIVLSNQVLEHVEDLEIVLKEISRLTKKNGIGLHIFPSSRHLIEAHLGMPIIHWFPKNLFRKLFILFNLIIGIDPKWEESKSLSIFEKTNLYYSYSINKTFYRSYNKIIKSFNTLGFDASSYGKDNLSFKNKLIKILKNIFSTTIIITKKR